MTGPAVRAASRHDRACAGFGAVVGQVGDRWDRPSPCPDWVARGVLEHVIGFHDVLLLRPLAAKPERPKDDPVVRWKVTASAITGVLERNGIDVFEVPGGRAMDLASLLPMLTTDVLVHTWDLARAADVAVALDPELCQASLAAVRQHPDLASTGMYAAAVDVPPDSDVADRLVAYLGRDPSWQPR